MNQKVMENLKQGIVILALGAIASMIPFYFQTSAMTNENHQMNLEQSKIIEQTQIQIQKLEVKNAIDDTEIKQIKNSLERIEKKIDRLIEQKNE